MRIQRNIYAAVCSWKMQHHCRLVKTLCFTLIYSWHSQRIRSNVLKSPSYYKRLSFAFVRIAHISCGDNYTRTESVRLNVCERGTIFCSWMSHNMFRFWFRCIYKVNVCLIHALYLSHLYSLHTYIRCTCIWYSNIKRPLTQKPPESTAHSIFAHNTISKCLVRMFQSARCNELLLLNQHFFSSSSYSLFSIQFLKQVQALSNEWFHSYKGWTFKQQIISNSLFLCELYRFYFCEIKLVVMNLSSEFFSVCNKCFLKSVAFF